MKKLYILTLVAAAMLSTGTVQAQTSTGNVLFYESFDKLAGQGGNDGYYENDSIAGVEVGAEDLLSTEQLDNTTGWGDLVKVAICNKCIRIATKKNSGEITTPAINFGGKTATLQFCAAAQGNDATVLYVDLVGTGSLTYGNTTAQQVAISLPESVYGKTVLANQVYSVTVRGVSGEAQIKFSTVSSKKDKQRAYLDEIKVTAAQNTGITAIANRSNRSNKVYNLTGQQLQSAPQHGIFIVNGKKVAR